MILSDETLFWCHFFHRNSHTNGLGANPEFYDNRREGINVRHVMADSALNSQNCFSSFKKAKWLISLVTAYSVR
jgi:hypothetical protein